MVKQVTARIDERLYRILAERARNSHRSITGELIVILEDTLGKISTVSTSVPRPKNPWEEPNQS